MESLQNIKKSNLQIVDHVHIVQGCNDCNIRHISICEIVKESELDFLTNLSKNIIFKKNSELFQQGDESKFVYSITSGVARIVVNLEDGRRQILGFLLPGDFIGITLEPTWNINVEAVTEISACKFSRLKFKEFMTENQNRSVKLQILSKNEIEELRKMIVILGVMSAEEKILKFIFMQKKRWDHIKSTKSDTVPIDMTRQDIANYLGMTIETVSRTFTNLSKKNIISLQSHSIKIL